jgi:hypothetical protein
MGAYTAAQRARVAGPFLGLSGRDVVYVVFALGLLLFTGVLTGRFRQGGAAEGKGHSSDVAQNPSN